MWWHIWFVCFQLLLQKFGFGHFYLKVSLHVFLDFLLIKHPLTCVPKDLIKIYPHAFINQPMSDHMMPHKASQSRSLFCDAVTPDHLFRLATLCAPLAGFHRLCGAVFLHACKQLSSNNAHKGDMLCLNTAVKKLKGRGRSSKYWWVMAADCWFPTGKPQLRGRHVYMFASRRGYSPGLGVIRKWEAEGDRQPVL